MEKLASKLSDIHDAAARERLASTLEHIVDEAEQLLHSAQRSGGEQLAAASQKFETQLSRARAELEALGDAASYRARRAARVTDHALHQHPYVAIGVAAGLGALLAAALFKRR